MGIFDRVGKVISANFNSLVDGLQDPRKSVEQTLLDLRDRLGLSWVLVTHDHEQAARMADWAVTRALGGTIVSEGPPAAAVRT